MKLWMIKKVKKDVKYQNMEREDLMRLWAVYILLYYHYFPIWYSTYSKVEVGNNIIQISRFIGDMGRDLANAYVSYNNLGNPTRRILMGYVTITYKFAVSFTNRKIRII